MYKIELYYKNKELSLDVNRDDFIEYLWEQRTGKIFRYVAYVLDDLNSKIYKEIENDYLNNRIDEYSILHDSKFKDFMIRKYTDELYGLTVDSYLDDFVDDANFNYINSLVKDDDR